MSGQYAAGHRLPLPGASCQGISRQEMSPVSAPEGSGLSPPGLLGQSGLPYLRLRSWGTLTRLPSPCSLDGLFFRSTVSL